MSKNFLNVNFFQSDLPNAINKSPEEMNSYCAENGFVGWFETSAKENKNIDEAARFLVEKILENHVEMNKEQNADVINFDDAPKGGSNTTEAKTGGCCGR
jgi:Ras-related protein Rab-32